MQHTVFICMSLYLTLCPLCSLFSDSQFSLKTKHKSNILSSVLSLSILVMIEMMIVKEKKRFLTYDDSIKIWERVWNEMNDARKGQANRPPTNNQTNKEMVDYNNEENKRTKWRQKINSIENWMLKMVITEIFKTMKWTIQNHGLKWNAKQRISKKSSSI